MTDDLLGGRRWRVFCGDVPEVLGGMADNSVHCVVTSPPYWGLRDYGIPPTVWDAPPEGCEHVWGEVTTIKRGHPGEKSTLVDTQTAELSKAAGNQGRFCRLCGAWRGALGLEPDIDSYVRHLVTVFRELWRVCRPDATVWLNISDSYASGKGTCFNPGGGAVSLEASKKEQGAYPLDRGNVSTLRNMGLKPKDLCLIPARVALALQQDGWWVRSRIIWAKGVSFCKTYSGSSMPESVTDRPSSSYEDVYLLTKSARYFYDQDAVRERHATALTDPRRRVTWDEYEAAKVGSITDHNYDKERGRLGPKTEGVKYLGHPAGRNLRSVWLINPHPFKEAHFATFPPALVEPMIKAGTSEKGVCPSCGSPWRRVVEKTSGVSKECPKTQRAHEARGGIGVPVGTLGKSGSGRTDGTARTLGWQPTCNCNSAYPGVWLPPDDPAFVPYEPVPAIVLDPFSGAGTTIMVALRLGRRGIGIDISEEYCTMARKRIIEDCPMWNTP